MTEATAPRMRVPRQGPDDGWGKAPPEPEEKGQDGQKDSPSLGAGDTERAESSDV